MKTFKRCGYIDYLLTLDILFILMMMQLLYMMSDFLTYLLIYFVTY